MFSFFKKKLVSPGKSPLPIITAKDLGIFPENIRSDYVGHDFCFEWNAVKIAAEKMNFNLDDYLSDPLVKRLRQLSLKSAITFWYTPLGKMFIVTAYSPSELDFFDPICSMQGYVDYGGNYLRSTARPFLHWDGTNVFRVQAISEQPNGLFLLADFGNGFGLNVSETDEDTYNEIKNNSNKHFEYSAVPHKKMSDISSGANLIQQVLCISKWG